MLVDVEKYRRHVQSIDLPQDRKDELIHTIYAILQSFVDRAFGVHPVQLSLNSRSQKLSEIPLQRASIRDIPIDNKTMVAALGSAEEGEIL
tara:strand:- start:1507 stop:1779 length:273 start_codon:yes stop_codon:yes gene_type:complete